MIVLVILSAWQVTPKFSETSKHLLCLWILWVRNLDRIQLGMNSLASFISRNSARRLEPWGLELSKGSFICLSGIWLWLSGSVSWNYTQPLYGALWQYEDCITEGASERKTDLGGSLTSLYDLALEVTLYLLPHSTCQGSCCKAQAIFKGKEIRLHPLMEGVSRSNYGTRRISWPFLKKYTWPQSALWPQFLPFRI